MDCWTALGWPVSDLIVPKGSLQISANSRSGNKDSPDGIQGQPEPHVVDVD